MAHVLVVEDNPVTRRTLVEALRVEGFAVREAADAASMLVQLASWPAGVVLLDIELPDASGLELLAAARGKAPPGATFLVCSSNLKGLPLQEYTDAGACDFLEKPVDLSKVVRMVRLCMAGCEACTRVNGERRKVLLVDGEGDRRDLLRCRLERMRFEVLQAEDYEGALGTLRAEGVFAVISECRLPERDGFELALAVRSVSPVLPVLILSDPSDSGARELGLQVGASEVVSRSTEDGELEEALQRLLSSRDSAGQAAGGAFGRMSLRVGRLLSKHDELLQQNAELSRSNQRLKVQLDILLALSNSIAQQEPEGVIERILALALDSEGFAAGGVVLPESLFSPGVFCVGGDPEWLRGLCGVVPGGPLLKPFKLLSRQLDPGDPLWEALRRPGVRCVLLVPLVLRGTQMGVLMVASERDISFEPETITFVCSVANQMDMALALRQSLLDERLAREVAQHQRRDALELSLRMQTILDNLDEGVITVNKNDLSEHWNKAALAMLGARPLGDWREHWAIYRDSEMSQIPFERSPLQFLLQGGEPGDTVLRFVRHGGHSPRWFKVSARRLFVEDGGELGSVLLMRDITGERLSEHKIRSSRANWMALVEHAPDLILHIDRDGVIQSSSKDAWGVGASSLKNRMASSLLPPESSEPWARCLSQAKRSGEATSCELLLEKGAEERWGSLLFGPIVEETLIVGFIVIIRDITDKKRENEAFLFADRMASVGMLAAGVAHEINNPLTVISTSLELSRQSVAEQGVLAAELLPALDDASIATERVRTIVRDLKIFSRSEEERMGSVNLLEVIETSIRLSWNEIRHRARLVRDFGPVPLIQGNESRLGQVFLNLLMNAAQAIPSIGQVDRHEITIRMRAEGGGVRVVIEDTGVGIAEDVQRRLFTPFFSTKPVGVGTGLGLSICRSIVEKHRGNLSLESTPGLGTSVSVLLPVGSPSATPRPQSLAPPRRGGGRVLVIDDEPIITLAVSRILSKTFDVKAVHCAKDALALLAAGEVFDLILCDLMMPSMSGVDFRDNLLRSFPSMERRLWFLTGGAFSAKTREFLDAHPGRFLEKPFRSKQLIHFVNEGISLSETNPETDLELLDIQTNF